LPKKGVQIAQIWHKKWHLAALTLGWTGQNTAMKTKQREDKNNNNQWCTDRGGTWSWTMENKSGHWEEN